MVINTPQPLVKPRREEVPPPAAVAAAVNRIMAEAGPRLPLPGTAPNPPAAAPKPERKAPAAKKAATKPAPAPAKSANPEEWTGSYSGRAMAPSLILCLGLSILAVWLAVRYIPSDWCLEFLGATIGGLWLLHLVRWGYRVSSYRYRLTREHLHLHRGLLYGRPVSVPRTQILRVSVSANLVERVLGVGRIVVEVQEPKDGKSTTVELEGILQPTDVVQRLGPINHGGRKASGK
jgi:hypothetical protein